MAGAENNRLAEAAGHSFDDIRAATRFEWARRLGEVTVEGGTPEQRRTFYSALYHTLVTPDLQSDADGRYRNHAKEIAQVPAGRNYYSTLSLWDTFRSWNPLQMLLHRPLVEDMVFSLLDMYACDGRLPMWPLGQADTYCMIGYHAVAVIADAWLQGIRSFDGEQALAAMIASSNLDPASAAYNQYGYAPCDRVI
jgi:putative alpha-1,2-mannosidase